MIPFLTSRIGRLGMIVAALAILGYIAADQFAKRRAAEAALDADRETNERINDAPILDSIDDALEWLRGRTGSSRE